MHKIIHNVETGQITEVELNQDEIAVYEASYNKCLEEEKISQAQAKAQLEAKEAAEAKLEALGLTAEDLKALGL
jgi:hypothetical protein